MNDGIQAVERILGSALEKMQSAYTVTELDPGEKFREVRQPMGTFVIREYDVEGVGHLQAMSITDSPMMQMATWTLTPYFKNLPLLSMDFMFMGDKRMSIMEIYELAEDRADAAFRAQIGRYGKLFGELASLPDMPQKPNWYDEIRPVFASKMHTPAEDDMIFDTFMGVINIFIESEKELPLLEGDGKQAKYNVTKEYVEHLIEVGGGPTETWKAEMGKDFVDEFFHKVFFGL